MADVGEVKLRIRQIVGSVFFNVTYALQWHLYDKILSIT